VNPTPRAAALFGAGALVALVSPAAAIALAAVAAVALAIDAGLARRTPGLRRSVATVAARGVPARFAVDVHGPDAGRVRVRQPRSADVAFEPPEATGRLAGVLVAERRGRHALLAVAARRTGPLGLAAWNFRGDGHATLTVFPDVLLARRLATSVRRGTLFEGGRWSRGPLGLGTEYESTRDYQPDDDVRQLNWAATARVGRPMSNQFRVEQDRDVVALVDTGRLMAAPLGDRTRLDAALDAVAALAAVADEVGDRCGVIAFDQEVRRQVGSRRRGADAVVGAVFDLEPRPVDADYELAFRSVRNTKRSLVCVFTDLFDDGAARSLLAAVPVLVRRHALMIVTARDPEVERYAAAAGEGTRDRWARVVADELLAARARVVAQLTASGARVTEAAAPQLPEAVVREYLRFKQRARL
jgi:uncharacterized protein (DUF58 family)